jgi:hypothetical protein
MHQGFARLWGYPAQILGFLTVAITLVHFGLCRRTPYSALEKPMIVPGHCCGASAGLCSIGAPFGCPSLALLQERASGALVAGFLQPA